MPENAERPFIAASSLDEALAARRAGATVLAGGTWLMRSTRRGVDVPDSIVTLHTIPALSRIAIEPDRITLGASVTHAALAQGLRGVQGVEAVVTAAESAANPAIRRAATLGGNLCTADFEAADLVPALLALDTTVELQSETGTVLLPFTEFLVNRRTLLATAILTRVRVARTVVASAHARLPLRRAGDYPVAIVSVAIGKDGAPRIAVGSVERVARRWSRLETAFGSRIPAPREALALAEASNDFIGRDSVEADGWYRRQVLPALFARAVAALPSEAVR